MSEANFSTVLVKNKITPSPRADASVSRVEPEAGAAVLERAVTSLEINGAKIMDTGSNWPEVTFGISCSVHDALMGLFNVRSSI